MKINNTLKFHQTNESINQIPFLVFDGIAVCKIDEIDAEPNTHSCLFCHQSHLKCN